MNTLRTHHRVALLLVVPLLVAIAADTIHRAVTGDPTFVTDDTVGPAGLGFLVNGWIAAALLSLAWVLRNESQAFAAAGTVARGARRALMVALPVLGVGLVVSGPLLTAFAVDSGPVYDASGLVAAACSAICVLGSVVLGLTQLRRNVLGLGGRLLLLIVPAALLTALLGFTVPAAASPVFPFAAMLGGLATVGVGISSRDRSGVPVA
jgi:hypothetical protein